MGHTFYDFANLQQTTDAMMSKSHGRAHPLVCVLCPSTKDPAVSILLPCFYQKKQLQRELYLVTPAVCLHIECMNHVISSLMSALGGNGWFRMFYQ